MSLENNVDIAIQRYGPYLAREVVRRAQGGGVLRDISQPISPGPTSVSLEGVSVNAVGLQENGSGVGSGGGIVIQTGTQPPNMDPVLGLYANFQHPPRREQYLLSYTPSLIADTRQFQLQYAQSFVTGTYAQLTYYTIRSSHTTVLLSTSIPIPPAFWTCMSRRICCRDSASP